MHIVATGVRVIGLTVPGSWSSYDAIYLRFEFLEWAAGALSAPDWAGPPFALGEADPGGITVDM